LLFTKEEENIMSIHYGTFMVKGRRKKKEGRREAED